MKTITVNGNAFKSMIKKAASLNLHSAGIPTTEQILIKVQNQKVCVCANNFIETLRMTTTTESYDEFEAIVDGSELSKIANIKGTTLDISYDDVGKIITFSDDKKSITIHGFTSEQNELNFESFSIPLDDPGHNYVLDINSSELLESVKICNTFTSKVDSKPILCGIHFNSEDNCIEALDGYRAIRRYLKTARQKDGYEFTMDSKFENVKNVLDKNRDINVYVIENKYTVFVDADNEYMTEYAVRHIQGKYFNVKEAIPTSFVTNITVNADEMQEICKEFKGYISAKDAVPMILVETNHKLYAYIKTSRYKVSQQIETANIDGCRDIYTGYKIAFMQDAMKVFDKGETVKIGYNKSLTPILISNGTYDIVVLPVRLQVSEAEVKAAV